MQQRQMAEIKKLVGKHIFKMSKAPDKFIVFYQVSIIPDKAITQRIKVKAETSQCQKKYRQFKANFFTIPHYSPYLNLLSLNN